MNPTEAVPSIEWDVMIDQLRAQTRVGIYGHERVSQPVVIDAVLHCRSQALPEHCRGFFEMSGFGLIRNVWSQGLVGSVFHGFQLMQC